jgi:hypothetical protein
MVWHVRSRDIVPAELGGGMGDAKMACDRSHNGISADLGLNTIVDNARCCDEASIHVKQYVGCVAAAGVIDASEVVSSTRAAKPNSNRNLLSRRL